MAEHFEKNEHTELFKDCIERCDFESFTKLLKEGYKSNSVDLFEKAYSISSDWAVLWIQNDFDVNYDFGYLFHRACEELNVDFAIFLLDHGADPRLKEDFSFSAFEKAAGYHGYLDENQRKNQEILCKYLLDLGLNPISESICEPCIISYMLGMSEELAIYLVDWLADNGCLNIPSTCSESKDSKHLPISHALKWDDRKYSPNILRRFIERGSVLDATGITNEKLFIQACRICGLDELRLIVSSGANIHETEQDGTNALYAAVQCERGVDIISFLVEIGLDVNCFRKAIARGSVYNDVLKAESVLEVAERKGNEEIVNYLLAQGALRSSALINFEIEDPSVGDVECRIVDGVLKSCEIHNRTTAALPQGIIKIAHNAFAFSRIEVLAIPEGVTCIENRAFLDCKLLRKLILPSTLDSWDFCKDRRFPCMQEYEVAEDNPVLLSYNGVLFNKEKTMLIRCPENLDIAVYHVPDSVTVIAKGAFAGCERIREIVLPNHSIQFEDSCFKDCSSLKKINLPDDLEEFPCGMFRGSGIEELSIPSRLRSIRASVFGDSKLNRFSAPPQLERIENYAFNACDLQDILIPVTLKYPIKEDTFSDSTVRFEVIFPTESYLVFDKDYKALAAFSEYYLSVEDKHDDRLYMDALEKKLVLKRHLVHVAMARIFGNAQDLDDEAMTFYSGIIKGNRKRAVVLLATDGNVNYLQKMVELRYVGIKEIRKILEESFEETEIQTLIDRI